MATHATNKFEMGDDVGTGGVKVHSSQRVNNGCGYAVMETSCHLLSLTIQLMMIQLFTETDSFVSA